MCLLVPAHPGSPGQRAIKLLLLLLLRNAVFSCILLSIVDDATARLVGTAISKTVASNYIGSELKIPKLNGRDV